MKSLDDQIISNKFQGYVAPPIGFGSKPISIDYRDSETLPVDEDGDSRPLTRDEKHYLPANEDERGE